MAAEESAEGLRPELEQREIMLEEVFGRVRTKAEGLKASGNHIAADAINAAMLELFREHWEETQFVTARFAEAYASLALSSAGALDDDGDYWGSQKRLVEAKEILISSRGLASSPTASRYLFKIETSLAASPILTGQREVGFNLLQKSMKDYDGQADAAPAAAVASVFADSSSSSSSSSFPSNTASAAAAPADPPAIARAAAGDGVGSGGDDNDAATTAAAAVHATESTRYDVSDSPHTTVLREPSTPPATSTPFPTCLTDLSEAEYDLYKQVETCKVLALARFSDPDDREDALPLMERAASLAKKISKSIASMSTHPVASTGQALGVAEVLLFKATIQSFNVKSQPPNFEQLKETLEWARMADSSFDGAAVLRKLVCLLMVRGSFDRAGKIANASLFEPKSCGRNCVADYLLVLATEPQQPHVREDYSLDHVTTLTSGVALIQKVIGEPARHIIAVFYIEMAMQFRAKFEVTSSSRDWYICEALKKIKVAILTMCGPFCETTPWEARYVIDFIARKLGRMKLCSGDTVALELFRFGARLMNFGPSLRCIQNFFESMVAYLAPYLAQADYNDITHSGLGQELAIALASHERKLDSIIAFGCNLVCACVADNSGKGGDFENHLRRATMHIEETPALRGSKLAADVAFGFGYWLANKKGDIPGAIEVLTKALPPASAGPIDESHGWVDLLTLKGKLLIQIGRDEEGLATLRECASLSSQASPRITLVWQTACVQARRWFEKVSLTTRQAHSFFSSEWGSSAAPVSPDASKSMA